MAWEGGKLLSQLSTSHQALTARLTAAELDLRNKNMDIDETEAELRVLKDRQAQAERDQLVQNKTKEALEAKMDLRRRQIERAMFILRKREEMFQNDLNGREVVQTILEAMTQGQTSNALSNVRELEDSEVDRIIYRLSETRSAVVRWVMQITIGAFDRRCTVSLN